MKTKTKNALNWFEIPAADFARARTFYQAILDETLEEMTMEGGKMAIFPSDREEGVGGAVSQMEGCTPGPNGTLVYLNVEGRLDEVLARIPAAGGQVIQGRMPIPPHGFIGLFRDSEGNTVGLHSMS